MAIEGAHASARSPRTLFDKVWDAHQIIAETVDYPAILSVDLHLVHEVTSPQAFHEIAERGLRVRRPDKTFATLDHSTPTLPPDAAGVRPFVTQAARAQTEKLVEYCAAHKIPLAGFGDDRRGIVHVIAPELGLTQPGQIVVCGDSHTATHGAFGAFAFGIGTSEVAQVLASQAILQRKPKIMRVWIDGQLPAGSSAKDLTLFVLSKLGFDGGTGHVLEFAGPAISALGMEARMTLCNMAIEAGARAGMIAPDAVTIDYLRGRPHVPQGVAFDLAAREWLTLGSDEGAHFDAEIRLNASEIGRMVTWGTTPDSAIAIHDPIPNPRDEAAQRSLDYMGFRPGSRLGDYPVDVVFIGSCTNGRLSDLQAGARILRGRKVKSGVQMIVVPGSEKVREAAEREGLDAIFLAAGAQWRLPGCSMCIAMNGDHVAPGQLAVSTSNRNFEGRQGKNARTLLASPAVAAASAIMGHVADPEDVARRYPHA